MSYATARLLADKPTNRRAVIHTTEDVSALLSRVQGKFECQIRGPSMASMETLQMQMNAETNLNRKLTDEVAEQLHGETVAGQINDPHATQVFIVGESADENERNTLAAINTTLISSAINDPAHTVAAFLPVGNRESHRSDTAYRECDPQPQVSALRTLLTELGVMTFESIDDLTQHMVEAF